MVTYMELHFAVRLLIIVIAVLAPILWQWRTRLAPSHAATVRYGRGGLDLFGVRHG